MLRMMMLYAMAIISFFIGFSRSNANYQNDLKGADTAFDTKDGLKIIIELDKATYSLLDDPALKVTFKNIGQEPITLYQDMGWGAASSLFLAIGDSSGKLLRPDLLSDAEDRPPFPEKDFTTLQPNETFILWRRFDMEGQGIKQTGNYSITVWYHSPVSQENAPQRIKVWTKENGTLRSKPFAFTVAK